jgi:hypothetical protein
MTNPTEKRQERSFSVLLRSPQKVNEPWLENQAILLEAALEQECAGEILGPSVAANFVENGFELDFTVEAESLSEAYDKLGKVLSVIERVAGITLEDGDADEVRSAYVSAPQGDHGDRPVLA